MADKKEKDIQLVEEIILGIENVKGVRKFKVQESPFIKVEKPTFNPVPQTPKSYDNPPQTS